MSYKTALFRAALIQPQPIYNFVIVFKTGILESKKNFELSLLVTSTEIPTPTWDEDTIYICGRKVALPTTKQVPGIWKCTAYESYDGKVFERAKHMLTKNISTHSAAGLGVIRLDDIKRIYARMCDIEIYIINSNLKKSVKPCAIIKNAWLQSIDPQRLDTSAVTEAMKWNLTFKYSELL